MSSARSTIWLNRFAWLMCVATLFLICSGGMVTSKGVGLAVPDWPTTFGYNMFLFPVSKWVGGIFFEHTHRLIASIVGFMTIILAVWLGLGEDRRWVRSLGYLALASVILQGVLGGLRVTTLKDEIGIFHACLAQAFLGLLVVIALATTKFWQTISSEDVDLAKLAPIKSIAVFTTVLIYIQLALGATMQHQHRNLAIPDFPPPYRQWIPDTSAMPIGPIIAVAVIAFCLRVWRDAGRMVSLRRLSILWVALLLGQVTLGAWTIWSNKAADIATAHVAIGATMLSFGVSICAILWRILRSQSIEKGAFNA